LEIAVVWLSDVMLILPTKDKAILKCPTRVEPLYVSTLSALSGPFPSGPELQEGYFACQSSAPIFPGRNRVRFTPESAPLRSSFVDSIATVGELQESIARHFGPAGWTALVSLWQEAVGIQPPKRQPKPDCAPIIAVEPDRKAETPLPPLPSSAYPMEEGLHRALNEMPEQVAAFLLHVPRDPLTWPYVESAGERAEREFLESQGGWTG
jgi:hypothetical protein